jgi:hypothetical protein
MFEFMQSRDFLTILFGAGALGCVTFVGLYLWRSVGWWRSDAGRNLMAVMAILLVLLGLVVVGRWWGPLPHWIWTVGVGVLDAAIWWRVIILWRKQHEGITP